MPGTPERAQRRSPAAPPERVVAGLGRRAGALLIDWWASWAVAALLVGSQAWATPAVFAAQTVVLLATTGASFGHRLVGLVVVPDRPAADDATAVRGIGLRAAAVRTSLLCLVLPAAVRDRAGRGLHDRAAGTVVVRLAAR